MTKNKPWYDDLRAIGSQLKAGYSEDLTGNAGQAMKAFSPKDSAVYQKGQELVDDAADTAKENASDYEGRGAIAKPLIHTARFVSGLTAPLVATAPLMVSPFAQAVTLGLLAGGSDGQKSYERQHRAGVPKGVASATGIMDAVIGGALGATMTPAAFTKGGFKTLTPSGSAEVTRSAGRAAERGFARIVNESGLATKKYDAFAANKAGEIDKFKTVAGALKMKALPNPLSSGDQNAYNLAAEQFEKHLRKHAETAFDFGKKVDSEAAIAQHMRNWWRDPAYSMNTMKTLFETQNEKMVPKVKMTRTIDDLTAHLIRRYEK